MLKYKQVANVRKNTGSFKKNVKGVNQKLMI